MDNFGNALSTPDGFFIWNWSPYGLPHWRSIEDDDFV
jgi:hypothetical protein